MLSQNCTQKLRYQTNDILILDDTRAKNDRTILSLTFLYLIISLSLTERYGNVLSLSSRTIIINNVKYSNVVAVPIGKN